MQVCDVLDYMNDIYQINDIENKAAFPTIKDFHLIPTMISTACYRGYVIKYQVTDLIFINSIIAKAENGLYPKINNIAAEPYKESQIWRSAYIYRNIDIPVNYSGHILICKGYDNNFTESILMLYFRRSRAVTIQYYSNVIELNFSNGELISVRDITEQNNLLKSIIHKNKDLFTGKPSERERISDDILLTVFGDYEWWMHREITSDMKQAESDIGRIIT